MRARGTVSHWDDERGFGFVTPDGGGARLFVHISALPRGRRPGVGDVVEYTAGADGSGRPRAVDVTPVGGRRPVTTAPPGVVPAAVVALLFLALLGVLAVIGVVSPVVLVGYALLSLLAQALYAADKDAARKGSRRVSERSLHLVDLLGGWPGGLVARHALRHKTRKQPFRTVFWVTVLVNGAALALLLLAGPQLREALLQG